MAIRKIEKESWQAFFDGMSKRAKRADGFQYAEVRVFSPDFGAQKETSWLPFAGITYDRHNDLVDLAVESMNHLIRRPAEVYADEDPSGIVFSLEILCEDGTKEVVEMR